MSNSCIHRYLGSSTWLQKTSSVSEFLSVGLCQNKGGKIALFSLRGRNYVKMSVFVHAQGMKTVRAGEGKGQKMAKFCPRSC